MKEIGESLHYGVSNEIWNEIIGQLGTQQNSKQPIYWHEIWWQTGFLITNNLKQPFN